MKARLIHEIGTRAWLRAYWGGHVYDEQLKKSVLLPDHCPNSYGSGKPGSHNAQTHLVDSAKIADWALGGSPEDYPAERWPTRCEHCGAPVPADALRHIYHNRLYDTPSGRPEPGDLFWAPWYHDPKRGFCPWENCHDPRGHLIAILPNGHPWDIDTRASNCTMPEDKTHRCWVRRGEPPDITAGKGGHTCSAGAGSIAVTGYHGFLQNGEFTNA